MNEYIGDCQWEDQTVMEGAGHPPSYAKAEKNEGDYARGCLYRASVRDWSSSMGIVSDR